MKLLTRGIPYLNNLCKRTLFSSNINYAKVNVGDFSINYESGGAENGKVALCMPGSMGSGKTDFAPQLELLGSDNLKVVCWDPPGYGYSRPPDRDFSGNFFKNDAEVAVKFMEALGHDKFSILGWSDGGITGLIMASKFPQNIDKMVLWGANAYITHNDIDKYEEVRDVAQWSPKMRAPMEAVYGPEYFSVTWACWVDAMNRLLNEKRGSLVTLAELEHIQCPTLIVHGRKDAMVGEEHAEYLHAKIQNSRLTYWDDGKHNLHLRYAEKFNELVTEFIHE